MSSGLKLGIAVLVVIVSAFISSYFLSMIVGLMLFSTPAGFEFGLGNGLPFIQFLFLWVIFALCFVIAWKIRRSFHEVVSRAFTSPFSRLSDNWLFVMPIIASALWFIVSSIIELQDLINVPTGGLPVPTTDAETFQLYLDLTRAPIIEELAFRIVPIGIVVLARLFLAQASRSTSFQSVRQKLKLFLFSFLFPDKAKGMVGMGNVESKGLAKGISKDEWFILLFTSLVFAGAHLISGIGWEYGKVTSVFVQGFVFGIVFLAYGFQAGILLHWFFNYYFYTFELGNYYLGWNLDAFLPWLDTSTRWIGGAFTIVLLILLLLRMSTTKKPPNSVAPESY